MNVAPLLGNGTPERPGPGPLPIELLRALAKDALRHRLVLRYQALAEGVTADAILDRVLAAVPAPEVSLARPSAA